MRVWRWLLVLAIAVVVVPAAADEAALRQFAQGTGIADASGFVDAVTALRERGRLPERWITKAQAERLGWRPGRDLCRAAPGRAIGGDAFGNRERRLPAVAGRRWYEADLDFACGERGARRLLWSSDGLIYVTVDHYRSFREVPR